MVVRNYRYIIQFLILILVLEVIAFFQLPDANLHIIACDVGQGDAILATYRNFQILTDGGPANGKVINCLSRHMPFWDREVEVVVNTHPQADHYGGLTEIFRKYKVGYFVANGLEVSSESNKVLEMEVGRGGAKVVNPVAGTSIRSSLISYDIFWPSENFLSAEGGNSREGKLGFYTSDRDPNDFSVQAVLSLGDFHALLTGDIGRELAGEVIPNLPVHNVNYIKVPHHGSKNGMTQDYLEVLEPKAVVISVGRNNTYGHPSLEIIDLLKSKGVKTYRTDESGDIEFVTNGERFWEEN